MTFRAIHHIAIICSDYPRSKKFYTSLPGFAAIREVYREDRQSWKLDLSLNGQYVIELFSFPGAPPRASRPEAQGLRHLCFEVESVESTVKDLQSLGIKTEPVRTDEHTGKKFTFFFDPDGLPLEIYEG